MVAGTFAKWYIAKLKAYPVVTNVSSAFVLMTTGDALAQELEVHHQTKDNFTMPDIPVTETPAVEESTSERSSLTVTWKDAGSWSPTRDPVRTATMAAWSVCVYTPFYVGLYRLYDRFLPKKSPASIVARVFLSFFCSVPVNAAFYTYGTAVNHTTEWLEARQTLRRELEDVGLDPSKVHETDRNMPFNMEDLWAKAELKLKTELPQTIVTSGSCWIPINLFTFSMVPSHLQPLSLMFFSVFWNCYLSLSHHRDVPGSKSTSMSDEQ